MHNLASRRGRGIGRADEVRLVRADEARCGESILGRVPTVSVSPAPAPARWTVAVPGSKSLTNRALLLAMVADGTSRLTACLDADDTRVMRGAMRALGASVEENGDVVTVGGLGSAPRGDATLWCGQAGTVGRFLVPVCAAGTGRFRFEADAQLAARPLRPVLAALEAQGARYASEGDGTFPLTIDAHGLRGGDIHVDAQASSQFLSGILLAAPLAQAASTVPRHDGVSQPYVELTLDAMRAFGAVVGERDGRYALEPSGYRATDYAVEPDASTASYFLGAAAVTGTTVTLPGIDLDRSRQGDLALAGILERMGCAIASRAPLTLAGAGPGELRGVTVDMSDCSDVFMTLACVAPFASGPTTITGIEHARLKESDRVAAVAENLARLGISTEAGPDRITVEPGSPQPGRIPSYDDHRVAMSFSIVGLRSPVEIEQAEAVAKTCPPFFELWRATGALIA